MVANREQRMDAWIGGFNIEILKLKQQLLNKDEQLKTKDEIIKVLTEALKEISENKNMTILGSDENGNPEIAHQIGANKGFDRQAEIADEALEKLGEMEGGDEK